MKSIILAAALAVLSVCAAHAQQSLIPCNVVPTEIAGQIALDQRGERMRHSGLDHQGDIVLVWVNEETGSWTLALANANGIACIVAFGEFWQEYQPEPNL